MSDLSQTMPVFLDWWENVNLELQNLAEDEINLGEARYWYERKYSPDTTARLIMEARLEERLTIEADAT